MSRLYGFNMFQLQEGGFTLHFVRECGKLLREEADKFVAILRKYDGDTLNASNYEITKAYLKSSIKSIAKYHFFLSNKYIQFLNEQTELVKHICAETGVLDQDFNYVYDMEHVRFGDLINIQDEFGQQYAECQEFIDNMVSYDDFTSELFDEYKLNLMTRVIGFRDRNNAFINLLIEEHIYNTTWGPLDTKRAKFRDVKAKFVKSVRVFGVALPKTRDQLNSLKAKVDKIRLDTIRPDSSASNLANSLDQLKKMGIEGKMQIHCTRYVNWIEYVKEIKESLNEMCQDIYTAEIMVNGLRLKGIVELRCIPKKIPLREEELAYIGSLALQYKSIVSGFVKLEEEVEATIEEIENMIEEKKRVV